MDLLQRFLEENEPDEELFQMTYKFITKMYELGQSTSDNMFDKISLSEKIANNSIETQVYASDYVGMRTDDDQFFKLYYVLDDDNRIIFNDFHDIDVDEYLDIINEKKHI